jgi:hypothetical protein
MTPGTISIFFDPLYVSCRWLYPTKNPTKEGTFLPCIWTRNGTDCYVTNRNGKACWKQNKNKEACNWTHKTIPRGSKNVLDTPRNIPMCYLYCTVYHLEILTHAWQVPASPLLRVWARQVSHVAASPASPARQQSSRAAARGLSLNSSVYMYVLSYIGSNIATNYCTYCGRLTVA